ncbi:efflux RND transporter permease subunit [Prolixibacteraceae bacterium Z1-6]|uniref:Efflux RND transporter permease subunit n=1 Tax=Draconibacterium aestuarii TaxID=2998507 RepID=A0A9X3F3W0_9BACT|nr:efflux RND transporter permease subunit [Prolixibacteraceae bacterium Z1-6]
MKKILTQFVKYPFYGKMVIIIFLLIGGISLMNMRKATFPLVESKIISVSVMYPGATPKEMDEGITSLVENSILGISGIKEFSSQSREGSASITITALNGYDMDELLAEVKNAVDGISNFPAAAERPIVSKQRARDMAMFMSLVSNSNDILELNRMANRIEDDLLATGKISQVSIMGLPRNLELAVELNETQMRRFNLTFSEIQQAISSNNLDISGGTIRSPREQIKVISRQRSIDPEDLKQIVIKANTNGQLVKIGDVATVTLQGPEDPSNGYINKKPAVTFLVQKLVSEDLEAISNEVNAYIKEFNAKNDDFRIEVKMDFLKLIDGQLSILINNGLLGVVLVILLLSLLLNIRLSLWVAWGIPASFLGMFIVATLTGVTINLISLFGMILIIGILVDDGVVIGENIFTHFEMGKSPRRAAIDGTLEVLPAVFTSVATTIIAFLPLLFIEGQMEMMYEMAFVVIICLLFSLLEGMFVLPGHLANPKVLKPQREKSLYGKLRVWVDKLIFGFRDKIYAPFLNWILKHKGLSIAGITSMFILTYGLVASGIIGFTFFPQAPSDMFSIDLALKPGINEEITKEKLFYIEDKVWEVNKELMAKYGDTVSYVSSLNVTMGSSFSGAESGTNAGMIRVFLNPLEKTQVSDELLKREIAAKVGKIPEAYKFAVGASNRFGAPVSISLLGYDPDDLELAKNELETELERMPALFNITNNSQIGSQELRLTLKPEAYALGITEQLLMAEVRQGFYGALAQRVQEGKDEIWVYVRYTRENRQNIGQLENMLVHTQNGNYPLGRIAEISTARSLSTINHFNGRREIRVDAYQKDQSQSVPDILDYIEAEILSVIEKNHPQITYMHQGQQKDTQEQMGSMMLYFGLAFLVIVLVIMIYFKSFRQGVLVIAMIPLGFIGAIWGHGIHGQPISMMSLWGMVALSGVIINDAIVFISKYNQNLEKGMKVDDAVKNAGVSRFRAIFLTTVTTTAGLMPLILENSPDARMLIPMAIALAYGILFGTVFILIILPVLVVLTNRATIILHRMRSKEEIVPESVETAVINANIERTLSMNMAKEFD